MKLIKHVFSSFLLAMVITAHAAPRSFVCPDPGSIITAGGFWFAPEVSGSYGGGMGIGGAQAGTFISSSPTTVNDKPGWFCFYNSTSHVSIAELLKQNNQQESPKLKNILEAVPDQQGTEFGLLAYQAQS
jgi:hypothetical protein